jgi:predicted enzyme related to lactoylglutathione lyase
MSDKPSTVHITDEERNNHIMATGKTFVWHQIYGANAQASIDFYTKALDWGTDEFPMGEGHSYKILTANGSGVAGVVATKDPKHPELQDVPPHWSVSITVDDVDARVRKCESLGAKVLQGPFDIPTVGRMALLQDPQGATFWLMKPMG